MIKTAQQLIEDPRDLRPHVVLLGAGASRAAFPNGDATGRRLPVMNDLVDIVELHPLIEEAGLGAEQQRNFEVLYGQLVSGPRHADTAKKIERRIDRYFSGLLLPNQATVYDRLLVSLRPTDAVFTFNWDPFLFDAYQRNRDAVPLPEIFFLHGNVRIGACPNHDKWGARKGRCPECSELFADVPLLYPIAQKNYSTDPYIRRNWDAATTLFRGAFTLTIFGYGAPDSDKDAVELLRLAWTAESNRTFEHIEIIDTSPQSLLHARWGPFAPTHHYRVTKTFEQSRVARWPRRSCESLLYPMTQGVPCEDFPVPSTDSIADLQAYAAHIARHEDRARSMGAKP
jgi:hypothetical protein